MSGHAGCSEGNNQTGRRFRRKLFYGHGARAQPRNAQIELEASGAFENSLPGMVEGFFPCIILFSCCFVLAALPVAPSLSLSLCFTAEVHYFVPPCWKALVVPQKKKKQGKKTENRESPEQTGSSVLTQLLGLNYGSNDWLLDL